METLTDNEALNKIVDQNHKIIQLLKHMADYDNNKTDVDSAQ